MPRGLGKWAVISPMKETSTFQHRKARNPKAAGLHPGVSGGLNLRDAIVAKSVAVMADERLAVA